MKRLILLSGALLIAQLLGAQALPLLYTPSDPRSSAMGGTGVALTADAWALDVNFAAAAVSPDTGTFGAAYDRWAPQPVADNRFAAGGWYRKGRLAFGLSARGDFAPAYEQVSAGGETLDSVQPFDMSAALGLAWSPAPGFALSAAARLVSSSLAPGVSGVTVCADLGILYHARHFCAGLSAANLGGHLRYGSTEAALPILVRGGGSALFEQFDVTAELEYLSGAGVMAGAGAEFRPIPMLALRAGYHYGPADKGLPSFGSCGLGLDIEGLGIDVAVLYGSPTLGGTLCAGLSYSF
ncbi:MAG: PorV/PorQ family protein [Bacteroidales bacterium]|nr:PorV/PorQ family protein [Bacteroidales bacterium]